MRLRHFAPALAIAIAAVAAAAGPAASGASTAVAPPCGPSSAHTLAANAVARIYQRSGSVYGCAAKSRGAYRLGGTRTCIDSPLVGSAVVLAGTLSAYSSETCGVDTGSTTVYVRRLTDGKALRALAAITGKLGPESYQTVDAIVLKRDGAVAWIATGSSIVGHGHSEEVHRADSRGSALLDSSSSATIGSLQLRGSKLSWKHGSQRRSSTLD